MTTLANLTKIADKLYKSLVRAFPEQDWTVLPEIEGNSCQMGFIILTYKMVNGKEESIVSRPRVHMSKISEFMTPEFDETILAVFELALTGSNSLFQVHSRYRSHVVEDEATTPVERIDR